MIRLGWRLDGSGHLFVANLYSDSIGEYKTSGGVVNAALITGVISPEGMTTDGNGHLFVCNGGSTTVSEYSVNGTLINASLITGLANPASGLPMTERASVC